MRSSPLSTNIRKMIIDAAHHAGHGHMPSALSIVETLIAIEQVKTEEDVFILSKGHGCLAYYSFLADKGVISIEELRNFGKKGSKLGGHPDRNKLEELYASTGSLGHGLPISVGAALARKIQNKNGKIYCLIGDGEANEGSIWEACMIAAKNQLDNLVCVVDNNNSQIRSLQILNLIDKFKAFGWFTTEVDGHSIEKLASELKKQKLSAPRAIIANTIKGKGIKSIENDIFAWHHRAPTELEYADFLKEIHET